MPRHQSGEAIELPNQRVERATGRVQSRADAFNTIVIRVRRSGFAADSSNRFRSQFEHMSMSRKVKGAKTGTLDAGDRDQ